MNLPLSPEVVESVLLVLVRTRFVRSHLTQYLNPLHGEFRSLVELESSDSESFASVLLVIITIVNWALMIFFLGMNLAKLLAVGGYSELTEIAHNTYLEPVAVLVSVFLWLPINALLTLICYLCLPFKIVIKRR